MKRWNEKEIEELKSLLNKGFGYIEISNKLDRTYRSVKEKCLKLNLSVWEVQKEINQQETNCLNCNKIFSDLESRKRKFCSKSCSVSYNNINRKFDYTETKDSNCIDCGKEIQINKRASISKSMCCSCRKKYKKQYDKIKYSSTPSIKIAKGKRKEIKTNKRIFEKSCKIRICKICNLNILKPKKQYCEKCNFEYYKLYRPNCRFRFNVYDYIEEFNISLVEEYGWYSPSNKGNNLNGISKDHIFSVKNGFINNVDPKVISHPANCKLMIHAKNNSKNYRSDITLNELLERIKIWDKKYKIL